MKLLFCHFVSVIYIHALCDVTCREIIIECSQCPSKINSCLILFTERWCCDLCRDPNTAMFVHRQEDNQRINLLHNTY